jgi:vancomycin resistance protein YoaR
LRDESLTPKDSRSHKSRHRTRIRVLVAVGTIVALCVLAIVIDAALYYNKVHPGVSVSGLSLGGLTHDEAAVELSAMVDEAQQSGIVLTNGDKAWTIMPTDVGTKMDVEGAVTAAMDVSREGNFFTDIGKRFKLYLSDVDLPLKGAIDSEMLDETLAGIAREIDVAPVNAGLAIDGTQIKVIEEQNGIAVDQSSLAEQLTAILVTLHFTEMEIPMTVVEPEVRAEDNAEAQKQAETMISAAVVVKYGDQTWSLTPAQIASCMDFKSEMKNGVSTLVPYLSAEAMDSFFDQIEDGVATEPVSATFKSDGQKAWVVRGVLGQALNREKTAEAISAASLETSGRTAAVGVDTAEPELTTEEAEARGLKDLLASYTTEPYAGSANRQVNVRITTEYASNVMLAPGEVYNFDQQIGPRTAARGYKTAPGIVGPGKLEDVFGGGICQVSTTLFNAVFFAGLEVVERHNHSIYIDHYPKGRDATVASGAKNLRFLNDTSHWIWILGTSDGKTTNFKIYGTDEGREVSYTTSDFYHVTARSTVTVTNPALGTGTTNVLTSGQSGKQLKCVRVVKLPDGTVLHKDTFISTFPMVPKQIEVGTGTTTTTTTVPTSTTTTSGPPDSTTTTSGPPDSTTTTGPPIS